MTARLLPLILLVITCVPSSAQFCGEDPHWCATCRILDSLHPAPLNLELTAGPRHVQVVEELLFGRRTSGVGYGLTVAIGRTVHRSQWELTLDGTGGGLENDDAQPTTAAALALMFRMSCWTDPAVEGLSVAVGPYVRGSSAIQFHETLDESHVYWLTAYELGPWARTSYRLDGSTLALLTARLPLAAMISRPDEHRLYNNDLPGVGDMIATVHRDLRFATVDTYRALEADLKLVFELDPGVLMIGYGLAYQTSTLPRPVALLTHAIHLSTTFAL